MPAAPAVAASAKQRRKFAPGRIVVGEPVFLQLQVRGTQWAECVISASTNANALTRIARAHARTNTTKPQLYTKQNKTKADGSDVWRLERAVELLKSGGIGIVPTDSLPAVVADLENRDAVAKLYLAMALSPKKRLSVLCRSFQDISHYTAGFRPALAPGQPDTFTAVRRMLPGPFTLIMPASKNLPPLVDPEKGKKQARKAVGVRIPGDPVCAALLEQFGGCLLSHSVHVPEHLDDETGADFAGAAVRVVGAAVRWVWAAAAAGGASCTQGDCTIQKPHSKTINNKQQKQRSRTLARCSTCTATPASTSSSTRARASRRRAR
jgi:tRNA threonylcarbamoyl adenosine modification protein (Sua5/YciO/YrdC/YwlC family)